MTFESINLSKITNVYDFKVDELGGEDEADLILNFHRPPINPAKIAAVLLCDLLGCLCIFLNAFVVFALLRRRRVLTNNVFYVLVLHCAIVDFIRGGCLIAWGMPHLLINYMRTMEDRLLALKINQFTLVILRSCNLLTIFNLTVFTTNEFIVIKYPLHYRRYSRRKIVLIILAGCWLISLLFGTGSMFSNFFGSPHSVMVETNGTTLFRVGNSADGNFGDSNNHRYYGGEVTRRETGGLSINTLSMLMIFILCYICLFTVFLCYGTILKTIKQFQSTGSKKLNSEESQRVSQRSSIYRKRSNILQKSSPSPSSQCAHHKNSVNLHKTSINLMTGDPTQPVLSPKLSASASAILDTYEEFGAAKVAEDFAAGKISISGSVKSAGPVMTSAHQGCKACCPQCVGENGGDGKQIVGRRCNSHRKWKSHLMSRHKYLIVIGSVLFVDVLFLFPYSGIQLIAFLHLNNLLATSQKSTLIRWGLQILIGVHSVCQPLCYFRMTEFRRLAGCFMPARRNYGSGTNPLASNVGTGLLNRSSTTRSYNNRSFGPSKDMNSMTILDLDDIVKQSHKKSIILNTIVEPSGSDFPSDYNMIGDEQVKKVVNEGNDWVNPSLNDHQWYLITQRRRWTRNLSLLCKEEGEELEVFLEMHRKKESAEVPEPKSWPFRHGYKRNYSEELTSPLALENKASIKKPTIESDLSTDTKEGTSKEVNYGTTNGYKPRESIGIFIDEEEEAEDLLSYQGEIEGSNDQFTDVKTFRILPQESSEGKKRTQSVKKVFKRFLTRLATVGRLGRDEPVERNFENETSGPFMESKWSRAGGGGSVKFRKYGTVEGTGTLGDQQKKLSNLSSGLRSNSVFSSKSFEESTSQIIQKRERIIFGSQYLLPR